MARCGGNWNNGSNNGYNSGYSGCNSLLRHINEFNGETVTIFTTSGGASGCGFTGMVISVNPCFVRLVTEIGMAPANPLAENICGCFDDDRVGRGYEQDDNGCKDRDRDRDRRPSRLTGSVVDIPVDRIVAFCHNAV